MKIEHIKWVAVEGDFSEGFQMVGPFNTHDEALEWAEKHKGGSTLPMFIANMVSPEWVESEGF